ncbi:MAG: twin-arginine translocase TatA/TatE family subunit [Dehalococcoidales bacterium]|nr:twin-arginine translocase TatA/TatE family subunit [Dehalococcoidales bacterium]
MDFLGIGPGEVLLILIVALLVVGPEKLVDVSKTLGKTVNSFKKAATDMTTQVTREIEAEKAALKRDIEGKEADPPRASDQADNAAKASPPVKGTGDK